MTRRVLLVVFALFLALGASAVDASDHASDQAPTVIHLSHYSDDLHRVSMALSLATNLQKGETPVTLFLDIEGVRLADARGPSDLRWGTSKPVSEQYDAFVKAGGRVLLCAHCAKAAGIAAESLRSGVSIASDAEVRALFSKAARVIDY